MVPNPQIFDKMPPETRSTGKCATRGDCNRALAALNNLSLEKKMPGADQIPMGSIDTATQVQASSQFLNHPEVPAPQPRPLEPRLQSSFRALEDNDTAPFQHSLEVLRTSRKRDKVKALARAQASIAAKLGHGVRKRYRVKEPNGSGYANEIRFSHRLLRPPSPRSWKSSIRTDDMIHLQEHAVSTSDLSNDNELNADRAIKAENLEVIDLERKGNRRRSKARKDMFRVLKAEQDKSGSGMSSMGALDGSLPQDRMSGSMQYSPYVRPWIQSKTEARESTGLGPEHSEVLDTVML